MADAVGQVGAVAGVLGQRSRSPVRYRERNSWPAPPAGRGPTAVRSWLRPPTPARPGKRLADAIHVAAMDPGIAERH
jgi:hypothetical protein